MDGENASVLATTCAGVCVVYASDNVPFASVIWRRYRFVAQLCEFREEKKKQHTSASCLVFSVFVLHHSASSFMWQEQWSLINENTSR